MISSATSTVRGSCTEERLTDFHRYLFFLFFPFEDLIGRCRWKFMIQNMLQYVSLLFSLCVTHSHSLLIGRGNASPKKLRAEGPNSWWRALLKGCVVFNTLFVSQRLNNKQTCSQAWSVVWSLSGRKQDNVIDWDQKGHSVCIEGQREHVTVWEAKLDI